MSHSVLPRNSRVWRDQVPEVRNVEGRPHVARKRLHHDEWDLPIAPYDPTGRASMSAPYDPTGRASMSSLMTESVIDQAGPRYTSLLTVIDHAGPVSDHAN
jgi:hypothetical protein